MRIPLVVVAVVLALGAIQVRAGDREPSSRGPVERIRFEVALGDLNLEREQDAQIALRRIVQASNKACGGHASFSPITGRVERSFYECRDEAIHKAVQQLKAPMVSRLYQGADEHAAK